jgi:hypothetical protein
LASQCLPTTKVCFDGAPWSRKLEILFALAENVEEIGQRICRFRWHGQTRRPISILWAFGPCQNSKMKNCCALSKPNWRISLVITVVFLLGVVVFVVLLLWHCRTCRRTPIHHEMRTGAVAGFLTGKKDRGTSNFLGRSDPSQADIFCL